MHLARFARIAALLATPAALACREPETHASDRTPRIVVRNRVAYAERTPPPVVRGIAELAPPMAPYREPWDRCRNASLHDTLQMGKPVSDSYLERGVALQCQLRADGPAMRVVVRGHGGIPGWADVYLPAGARTPTQRLELERSGRRANHGGAWAHGQDLNGDGWTDLQIEGNPTTDQYVAYEMHSVFVYDSATRRFARADGLSGKTWVSRKPDHPCAAATSGVPFRTIHQTWCWRGGRFVLAEHRVVHRLDVEHDTVTVFLDSISMPRNGRFELVGIDTTRVY